MVCRLASPCGRAGLITFVCLFSVQPGSGLSYGTAGNSATIHGSSGLFRRDQGGYLGGRSATRSRYSSYGGYSPSSGSADEIQKETKYYYGGKYQGIRNANFGHVFHES